MRPRAPGHSPNDVRHAGRRSRNRSAMGYQTTGYQTLRLTREGRVATLVLDRPERMNAFDARMREELPLAWDELAADPEVWCVILTGAGERAFCAGMDL